MLVALATAKGDQEVGFATAIAREVIIDARAHSQGQEQDIPMIAEAVTNARTRPPLAIADFGLSLNTIGVRKYV